MERPIVNVVATGTTRDNNAQYRTNVLKANVPFAEQVADENVIYVIRWDFDLEDEEVAIPVNCVLQFEGGSISNGTLVGNNTNIDARPVKIFGTDIVLEGSWNIVEVYPEWFGAVGDGVSDDYLPFTKLNMFSTLDSRCATATIKLLSNKVYAIYSAVTIDGLNIDLNNSCIRAMANMDYVLGLTSHSTGSGFGYFNQIGHIYNGNLDGNGFAETVLYCDTGKFHINNVFLLSPKVYGIKTSTTAGAIFMSQCDIIMKEDKIPNNTTYAIYAAHGDDRFDSIQVIDFTYAIYEPSVTGNLYENIHAWSYHIDVNTTVFARAQEGSFFSNIIIDTIKRGFEIVSNFSQVCVVNALVEMNTVVWRDWITAGSADDYFLMIDGNGHQAAVFINNLRALCSAIGGFKLSNYTSRDAIHCWNITVSSPNTVLDPYRNELSLDSIIPRTYSSLPSNWDLNNFKNTGLYFINSAQEFTNCPTVLNGNYPLVVNVENYNGVTIKQTVRRSNAVIEFIRFYSGSTWTNWFRNLVRSQDAPLYGELPPQYGREIGMEFFVTGTRNKPIWWSGSRWVNSNGQAATYVKGTTHEMMSIIEEGPGKVLGPEDEGYNFFNTDYGYPCYLKKVDEDTVKWVKADGTDAPTT